MAFDALDDHEQGELVRKWLRENGASILIGVGLGLLLIFGWQQWRTHRARHQAEAAVQYQALTKAADAKDAAAVTKGYELLKTDYADSAYAVLGAMREAESALARSDKAAALAAAQWGYDHASGEAMKTLAGLRLARVQLGDGKVQEALALADALPAGGYAALIAELRGDAFVALGKPDEARTAYQAAIDASDASAPNRATLEMKLHDIGAPAAKEHS